MVRKMDRPFSSNTAGSLFMERAKACCAHLKKGALFLLVLGNACASTSTLRPVVKVPGAVSVLAGQHGGPQQAAVAPTSVGVSSPEDKAPGIATAVPSVQVPALPAVYNGQLRPVSMPTELKAEWKNAPELLLVVQKSIDHLQSRPKINDLTFRGMVVPKAAYMNALLCAKQVLLESKEEEAFFQGMSLCFVAHRFGVDSEKDKITAYYTHVTSGCQKPSKQCMYPLFATPPDLVRASRPIRIDYKRKRISCAEVDAVSPKTKFLGSLRRCNAWKRKPNKKPPSILIQVPVREYYRGRYVKTSKGKRLVSYYTRAQIDRGALKKHKGLVLAYVHPRDAFLAQIEGSMWVQLPDGPLMKLAATEQNGHPFGGFSKELVRDARAKKMKVPDFLSAIPPKKLFRYFWSDPSYVFWEQNEANTSSGMVAIPKRVIATDHRNPKGVLAFLTATRPDTGEKIVNHLTIDGDIGGSIKTNPEQGPVDFRDRADWYVGEGEEAEKLAGTINAKGIVFYLLPHPDILAAFANQKSDTKNALVTNNAARPSASPNGSASATSVAAPLVNGSMTSLVSGPQANQTTAQ